LGNLSHDVGVEQIMKFGEYIRERKRIFNIQDANIECMNLLWGSNSLGGEVGEFQNMVKKIYRDHGSKIPDALKEEMDLELGDQFWYFIFIFDIIESNPMLVLGSYDLVVEPDPKYDSLMKISNAMGAKIGRFQEEVDIIYTQADGRLNDYMKQILVRRLSMFLKLWFLCCMKLDLDPLDVIEKNMDKLKERYNIA